MGMYEKKYCQSPISVPFPVSSWCSQKEPGKHTTWRHEPPDSGSSAGAMVVPFFLLTDLNGRLDFFGEEYGGCVDSDLSLLKYFSNIKMMWLCLSRHSFIWSPMWVRCLWGGV